MKAEDPPPDSPHSTVYHGTPTGCNAYCALAFGREGNDNTCMPDKPECANWLGPDEFPGEDVTVGAWCICGAKLPGLAAAGQYVHTGTILSDRGRRAAEEAPWRWPDAVGATPIDALHGAVLFIRTTLHNPTD